MTMLYFNAKCFFGAAKRNVFPLLIGSATALVAVWLTVPAMQNTYVTKGVVVLAADYRYLLDLESIKTAEVGAYNNLFYTSGLVVADILRNQKSNGFGVSGCNGFHGAPLAPLVRVKVNGADYSVLYIQVVQPTQEKSEHCYRGIVQELQKINDQLKPSLENDLSDYVKKLDRRINAESNLGAIDGTEAETIDLARITYLVKMREHIKVISMGVSRVNISMLPVTVKELGIIVFWKELLFSLGTGMFIFFLLAFLAKRQANRD